jgi:hypothetical protein
MPGTRLAAIHVSFRPNTAIVPSAGRFITEFCGQHVGDPDATSRVALCAHELLENLCKYSAGGDVVVEVELIAERQFLTVTIRTKNQSTPEHLAELRAHVDDINEARDPVAFYDDLIARSAKRVHGSGLGLARIRAEAEMELACLIEAGQALLTAETTVVSRRTFEEG